MVLWRKRLKDRKMQDLTNDRVELHELQFDAFFGTCVCMCCMVVYLDSFFGYVCVFI